MIIIGILVNRYKYDTDKTLTQLKFTNFNGSTIGAFNWFAVHATSMNNTNKLVTSDNVGYASILLESAVEPDSLPGKVDLFALTTPRRHGKNLKFLLRFRQDLWERLLQPI